MNQKTWTGESPAHVFWFCWELKNTPLFFHLESPAHVFFVLLGVSRSPRIVSLSLFHYNLPAAVDVYSFGFRTANALTLKIIPNVGSLALGPLCRDLLYC